MLSIARTLALLGLLLSFQVMAKDLNQVTLDENDFLLLAVQLNKNTVNSSVDAYLYDEQLMLAIEPLFNSLKLRYQLRQDSLTVWKNDTEIEYQFVENDGDSKSSDIWANDGYFQYISQGTLAELFGITTELNRQKLTFSITTEDYQFPITIIQEQAQQRFKNQAYQYRTPDTERVQVPITVPDQYRLATLPHGEVFHSLGLSDDEDSNRTSVQLISDLFYHSARINLNKSQGDDISGGLNFTRYKTSPDDRILGAFDQYSFGDVSSYSGGSIAGSQSGVGFSIQRNNDDYRQSNTLINIEEQAPPGWEAELFLNNRLITSTTVPETGLLIFNDVDIYYGRNDFLIKVYGPYGELEEYQQSYPLTANPLAKGNMAYSAFVLDNQRTVLNGGSDDSFDLNSIGGAFDYGVSDRWQLGFAVQNYTDLNENDRQLLGINNYLNFPGMLLENKLIINDDAKYEQQTSLSGSLFGEGVYSLEFDSSNGFNTNSDSYSESDDYQQLSLNYSDWFLGLPFRLSASHYSSGNVTTQTLSHNTNVSYQRLRFTHSLSYAKIEQDFQGEDFTTDSLTGSLGISGNLGRNLRLSADLQYDTEGSDFLLNSSRISAQYKWQDPYFFTHYFTYDYRPITDSDNDWQLSHRLAFETEDYRLSLRSNYSADETWRFALNFNFYFGYDYYNQRALTSSQISQQSATLDIHAYLDRQLNGVPDVLDYNLEGVEFDGNQDWQGLTTGDSGKILLPGASANTPFRFGATWKDGSKTINNDYVVYTHPGARVSVNMPFYLTTDMVGFVYRQAENGDVPVSQIRVDLVEDKGDVVQTQLTDIDGYFEFINMKPNVYSIVVNQVHLHEKALTSDVIGYKINTPNIGGFTELPPIYVRQQVDSGDLEDEKVIPFSLAEDDVEVMVWDEKEDVRRNYFSLPTDKKITAAHSLDAPKVLRIEAEPQAEVIEQNNDRLSDIATGVPEPEGTTRSTVQPAPIDGESTQKSAREIDVQSEIPDKITGPVYSLQLGAFMQRDGAVNMADRYESMLSVPLSVVKSKQRKWQTIYKVFVGKFDSKQQASNFAKRKELHSNDYMIKEISQKDVAKLKNIDSHQQQVASFVALPNDLNKIVREHKVVEDDNAEGDSKEQGWVIQFHASKKPIQDTGSKLLPSGIPLFQGNKYIAESGSNWHCLISQTFDTEQDAISVLQANQIEGWVSRRSAYSDVSAWSDSGVKL